jgi:hypothetical protein
VNEIPTIDLRPYLTEWRNDLDELRQNTLLSESSFLTFAQERGLPVRGVITGDPSEFNKRGWLIADEMDEDGTLRFHPFRLYPLHGLIKRRTAFGTIDPNQVIDGKALGETAVGWNTIA